MHNTGCSKTVTWASQTGDNIDTGDSRDASEKQGNNSAAGGFSHDDKTMFWGDAMRRT